MGGFGVVCPGRHRETGEVVAVKSVAKKSTTRDRMLKEAEVRSPLASHQTRLMCGDDLLSKRCQLFLIEASAPHTTFDFYELVLHLVVLVLSSGDAYRGRP